MVKFKFSKFLLSLLTILAIFINANEMNKSFAQNLTFIPKSILNKITFDIKMISPNGLVGDLDSLTSVDYEFCLPSEQRFLVEVLLIDPTIKFYHKSRGRINCKSNQYLCIGNTHKPKWKTILLSIAKLDYVERIDRFYGE